MFLGLLSGTAHPGLRVRDQVIEVDGPGFCKGQQAELNRGRIAPGIRHQVCALDFCAIHFRQTVHCLTEKLGRSVLDLVPRSEERRVGKEWISRWAPDQWKADTRCTGSLWVAPGTL